MFRPEDGLHESLMGETGISLYLAKPALSEVPRPEERVFSLWECFAGGDRSGQAGMVEGSPATGKNRFSRLQVCFQCRISATLCRELHG